MAESQAERAHTTWRYAMTREVHDGEPFYTIREVYSSDDGKVGWTEDAIAARGDSWQECGDDLSLMGRALGSNILDISGETYEWIKPREATERDRALTSPPAKESRDA